MLMISNILLIGGIGLVVLSYLIILINYIKYKRRNDDNYTGFDIAKEMFFDINPVGETGVKSCMFPYHEMKRLIHNIRNPENPDDAIICSGVEALGWLWL